MALGRFVELLPGELVDYRSGRLLLSESCTNSLFLQASWCADWIERLTMISSENRGTMAARDSDQTSAPSLAGSAESNYDLGQGVYDRGVDQPLCRANRNFGYSCNTIFIVDPCDERSTRHTQGFQQGVISIASRVKRSRSQRVLVFSAREGRKDTLDRETSSVLTLRPGAVANEMAWHLILRVGI